MTETKLTDANLIYQAANGVYLNRGETVASVIAADARIFQKEGVSPHEAGASLRRLFSAFNEFKALRQPGEQELIPGVTVRKRVWPCGRELVSFPEFPEEEFTSYIDWRVSVEGEANGNKSLRPSDSPTVISDMLPELIGSHGFCEGTVPYGLKPEWVIKMHHRIQESNLKPYVPKYTKDAWDAFRTIPQVEFSDPNLAAQEIINNGRLLQDDDRMQVYVAPGDLDVHFHENEPGYYSRNPKDLRRNKLWGIVIGKKDTQLALNERINNLPLEADFNYIKTGEVRVIRVWPTTEKLVS